MVGQTGKKKRVFWVLWLIPIFTLGYVGWLNLNPVGTTITHRIDVGADDTQGAAIIVGPFDRISSITTVGDIGFREMLESGVYFQVEDAKLHDADEVHVRLRFYDAFPSDAKLILGARDKQEWSYSWIVLYDSSYEQLSDLPAIVEKDGGWIIAEAIWNMEDLFVMDNKLSFCFHVPHLAPTHNPEKTIPIDWIEISLDIPPIWERL